MLWDGREVENGLAMRSDEVRRVRVRLIVIDIVEGRSSREGWMKVKIDGRSLGLLPRRHLHSFIFHQHDLEISSISRPVSLSPSLYTALMTAIRSSYCCCSLRQRKLTHHTYTSPQHHLPPQPQTSHHAKEPLLPDLNTSLIQHMISSVDPLENASPARKTRCVYRYHLLLSHNTQRIFHR